MTLARTAAYSIRQRVDDFNSLPAALVTHGLVTERYPQAGGAGARTSIRGAAAHTSSNGCATGGSTGVRPAFALLRRPAELSSLSAGPHGDPVTAPFGPQAYASLCLVLASARR